LSLLDEERPQAESHIVRQKVELALPPYFEPFLGRHPYNVLEGGRGGAKSRSVATHFVIEACQEGHRYLCTREFQSTMRDSVRKLLVDAIYRLNLEKYYDIKRDEIRCPHTGSEFMFKGLKKDPQAVRSAEGIDRCWVEEAHVVSGDSWQVLMPTLDRVEGSQLWVTFNPDSEEDPTYEMWIKHPPPGTMHKHVTWKDNPWFPAGLDRQRRHMLRIDPDAYDWIWNGHVRKLSEAVIFRNRVTVDDFVTPEDARFYYGADWGFAEDPSVLIRCFIHEDVLFIDHEAYGYHVEMDDLPALWKANVPYTAEWPIMCDNARPETIAYMKRHGFPRATAAEKWKGSVEDGIAYMKQFKRIVVHPRCPNIAQEFRLYSYKKEARTNRILPVVVSMHDHGIDSCRYALSDLIRGGVGYFKVPDSLLAYAQQKR